MSWDRLTQTKAPAATVLTLAQAKTHCRYDDTDQDDWFTGAIAVAQACIEGPKGIGVALLTQQWRMSADDWSSEIIIPLGPVSSIDSIKYQDLSGVVQTLAPAVYVFDLDADPVRIRRAYGAYWPPALPSPGSVKVAFTCGYGAAASSVPADLVHAMKLIVSHYEQHRDAVVGVDARDSSTELPMGVTSILERYRVGRIA